MKDKYEIKNQITRIVIIFILSAGVTFLGITHYKIGINNKKKTQIFANQIPIEELVKNNDEIGQINYRGLLIDVKRELNENPISYVKRNIENANFANGAKKIELNKLNKNLKNKNINSNLELIFFVAERGQIMRGYLLRGISGKTRITSVEIPLKKIEKAINYHSRIDTMDIPPGFLSIMPSIPELYIKNNLETGFGIYSCRAKKIEKEYLIREVKQRMIENGWKLENWDPALKEEFKGKEFFLSAYKDDILCHFMVSENKFSEDLHLTYKFYGSRYALVNSRVIN